MKSEFNINKYNHLWISIILYVFAVGIAIYFGVTLTAPLEYVYDVIRLIFLFIIIVIHDQGFTYKEISRGKLVAAEVCLLILMYCLLVFTKPLLFYSHKLCS